MPQKVRPEISVRTATPEDGLVAGQICFNAFSAISAAHGFPCDLPSSEAGIGLLSMMFSSPGFYCVVAEHDGRIVGSNCLDERSVIRGTGSRSPSTRTYKTSASVASSCRPRWTARRRGRALPESVSSVQAAFHNRSFSLYTSLGFDIREPLSCLRGADAPNGTFPDALCDPLNLYDADACNALSRRVHGFDRGVDLAQAIEQGTARVVERGASPHRTPLLHARSPAIRTAEMNIEPTSPAITSAGPFGSWNTPVPSRNSVLPALVPGDAACESFSPMILKWSTRLYNDPKRRTFPSVRFLKKWDS